MKAKLLTWLWLWAAVSLYGQTGAINLPNAILGTWDVWIPGAITYEAKGAEVYQRYQPGSAMSQLQIDKDGTYRWGKYSHKIEEVRPWYEEEGKRYFRILDLRKNSYDFWYKESADALIILFGEVGGHAATGTRIGNGKTTAAEKLPTQETIAVAPAKPGYPTAVKTQPQADKPTSEKQPTKNGKSKQAAFKLKENVEVLWSGAWYKAQIIEINAPKYKVTYTGWGSLYDEWVTADRIKKR
ncbi:Tudor-knot domain-containing protein [Sphingobacterium humi]|uniref:Agenet domain-containing protein n=1 Tax=Sphingobacterium humi TaxID=1796905 RepID=A0A6N8KT04_9SPHI|nr:Tudor-knot domain-containing protein [Sphingobacterium humi]MVZ60570.1 Agenet domain-containing protein [Sphingobacterium humi]